LATATNGQLLQEIQKMNLENNSLTSQSVVQRGLLPIAAGVVIALWLAYTTLQTLFLVLQLDEVLVAVLEYIPGILGMGVLLTSDLSRDECYLRLAWLSWKGLLVLAAFSLLWPCTRPYLPSGTPAPF
jgi:hypothetical protein